MNYLKNKKNHIAQIETNHNFPEIPNYPVPNPGTGDSGKILAIVMAMTIFGCVVKKLVA